MPLLAPPSSTIVVTSSDVVLPATGRSILRATVLESGGTPVQNGTVVTFSTNLGAVAPREARTQDAVATVEFLGTGQSGTASIRASSGGSTSEAIQITVGAAAASRVTLTASPTTVPPTGGSSTLTAVVFDASGNPLPGVPVTFITNAGTFSNAVVNSDSGGAARTTLTTTQAATVTASAGAATSGNVSITVAARPSISISLVTQVPVEGGITTFTVTVPAPAAGNAPIQRISLNYGDGASDDLGSVSGTLTAQHVYSDDGTFTVTATVTDSAGETSTASLVIVVQPLVVVVNATVAGTTATFTVTAPPAGVTVTSYLWNFGDGTANVTTTGTTVSHTYAGTSGTTRTFNVRVTARTGSNDAGQGSTSVTITFP